MVAPSVFDRSQVNCYQQTDLKVILNIRRPKKVIIAVKINNNCENIEESAKYSLANHSFGPFS